MTKMECYVVPNGKLKTLVQPSHIISSPDCHAVNIKTLKILVKDLKSNGTCASIHELLEGCELVFQMPQKEPRNPELHARVEKLKVEQANKEYEKMTQNVQAPSQTRHVQDLADVKSVNAQVAAVLNFVFTVGGSFAFTYKAVEYALPEPHIPAQVLLGLLAATAVAIADLYFLIRSL